MRIFILLILSFFLISFVSAPAGMKVTVIGGGAAAGGDYYATNGWTSQATITIQNAKVDAELSNFPVYLVWDGNADTSNIPAAVLNTGGDEYLSAGGGDIRFHSKADPATATDGRLDIEIVNIDAADADPSDNDVEIYVEVPTVASGTDTAIYMFWGKAAQTQPAADAAYGKYATWDANYVAVYHLNEDCDTTADCYTNSAQNLNHGTGAGGSGDPSPIAGQVGEYGTQFVVANTHYINCGSDASLDFVQGTLEVWAYIEDTIVADRRFVGKDDSGTNNGDINFGHDGAAADFSGYNSDAVAGAIINSNDNPAIDTWHMVQYVFGTDDDAHTAAFVMWVNKVEQTDTDAEDAGMNNAAANLTIGANRSGSSYWGGNVDEVRLSNTRRTTAWLNASFENQNDPNAFAVEGAAGSP